MNVATAERLAPVLARAIAAAPPKHVAMLQAHFRAPDQTITATGLARAVGYPNFSSANLQYGLFAKHVGELLGVSPRPECHVEVLVEFVDPTDDESDIAWRLRPEVVTALTRLGWQA